MYLAEEAGRRNARRAFGVVGAMVASGRKYELHQAHICRHKEDLAMILTRFAADMEHVSA